MHDENSCSLQRNGHWLTHHIYGIVAINIVAYKENNKENVQVHHI